MADRQKGEKPGRAAPESAARQLTKKERRAKKQRERDEKLREEIASGKVRYEKYQDRNERRRAQKNRKSAAAGVDEEMAARQELAEKLAKLYTYTLRPLLAKLSKIPDPRNPLKTKHKITVLMAYGVMMFVFRAGSRRSANGCLSTPTLFENMRAVIPEFESMPHADTLARLLAQVGADGLEAAYESLLKDLKRKKKFRRLLINGRYAVAVDGSQKFVRNHRWHDAALERHVGDDKTPQYYVYVLESTAIFSNGMVLPVYTETLSNEDWDPENGSKQDCESKAFKRLAPKLHGLFGGKVTLLADGLYACEPVMRICRKYKWEFMITLKDGSMPEAWTEFECHTDAGMGGEVNIDVNGTKQHYRFVNNIGADILNERSPKFSVVTCTEAKNRDRSGVEPGIDLTLYAWVSSFEITARNVARLCNKLARKRWAAIESTFHIEKHDGYEFGHCYSLNWDAMCGFHVLMKIAHCLNELMSHSEIFAEHMEGASIKGFIDDLFLALRGSVLDTERIIAATRKKFLWRISLDNVFLL